MEDSGRRCLAPPQSLCSGLFSGSIAVATSASVTTSATTTITAAATAGALFARPGNVDIESTPAQLFTVQCVDGFLRLFGCAHGYEGEAARTACGPVSDKIGFDDCAMGGEGVLEFVFGDFEVNVPDE